MKRESGFRPIESTRPLWLSNSEERLLRLVVQTPGTSVYSARRAFKLSVAQDKGLEDALCRLHNLNLVERDIYGVAQPTDAGRKRLDQRNPPSARQKRYRGVPICFYNHTDADIDAFTAAWIVYRAARYSVDFFSPMQDGGLPAIKDRPLIIIDGGYARSMLEAMASKARDILVIDNHPDALREIRGIPTPTAGEILIDGLHAIHDKDRSLAGITWGHFNPRQGRPLLVDYIEDIALGRYALPHARDISAFLTSRPLGFGRMTDLMERKARTPADIERIAMVTQAATSLQADDRSGVARTNDGART